VVFRSRTPTQRFLEISSRPWTRWW
jgi:hypothetical protein